MKFFIKLKKFGELWPPPFLVDMPLKGIIRNHHGHWILARTASTIVRKTLEVNDAISVAQNGKHNYELSNQTCVHVVSQIELMRKVNKQNKNFCLVPSKVQTSPKAWIISPPDSQDWLKHHAWHLHLLELEGINIWTKSSFSALASPWIRGNLYMDEIFIFS